MQSFLGYLNLEDSMQNMGDEIEVAVTLLLSLNTVEPSVDELVKACYPFTAFDTDRGKIYFDLLMLSEEEKPLVAPLKISEKIAKLVASKDQEISDMVESCKSMLIEPGHKPMQIKGLVENEQVIKFLQNGVKIESEKCELYKPQLTQRRFKGIKEKILKKQKEREDLLKEISQAKEDIQEFHTRMEAENRKLLESFSKKSDKKLEKLEKQNNKAIKEAEKEFKKQCKLVNKEFDNQINELNNEKELVSNKQKELQGGGWETRKQRLENELKLRQLARQLESLEKERSKELKLREESREKTEENLKTELFEAEEKERKICEDLEDEHKKLLEEISDLNGLLANLEKQVEQEREYLARMSVLKYKDGEKIYVPFYIYKTNGDYGVHPPVKARQSSGVKKAFNLILAESLRDKVLQYVEYETDALDQFMDKILIELSSETGLRKEYDKKLDEENLLTSRISIDKIEVGLYKLYELEWVNEKDYMVAQRCLVEKMDKLNGGGLFIREDHPTLEVAPLEEIPA